MESCENHNKGEESMKHENVVVSVSDVALHHSIMKTYISTILEKKKQ